MNKRRTLTLGCAEPGGDHGDSSRALTVPFTAFHSTASLPWGWRDHAPSCISVAMPAASIATSRAD